MVNTGYRPSEAASLTAAQIRLDVDVPHISIEPDDRQLKSRNAQRVIPLVGGLAGRFQGMSEWVTQVPQQFRQPVRHSE